jgi:hypothetical protein
MARYNGLRRRAIPLLPVGWGAALLTAAMVCAFGARAGESHRTIDVGRLLDAGAQPDMHFTPTPPDPAPLVSRTQWIVDLRWDRGDVWLLGIRKISLPAPQATPRVMGRFALELFEGPTLIERVRFDFPLLAIPDSSDAGSNRAPSFTDKLRTRIGVVFPATTRGTRLELADRATGRRWPLPWPMQSAPDDDAKATGDP